MSDDRAFGRDPKGFMERRRAALQRPGGCGDSGGCGGDRGCVGRSGDSVPGRRSQSSATMQASPVSSSQAAVVELSYQSDSDEQGVIGVCRDRDGLERWEAADAASQAADAHPASSSDMTSTQKEQRQRGGEARDRGVRKDEGHWRGYGTTALDGASPGDGSQEDEGPELIGCPLYANQVRYASHGGVLVMGTRRGR